MKKLTILLLSILISFNSYGGSHHEWTKIVKHGGDTFYIDMDHIKIYKGHFFYHELTDLIRPDKFGNLSTVSYYKANCEYNQYRLLTLNFYSQPMGRGDHGWILPSEDPNNFWIYPSPGSVGGKMLKTVCDYVD